LRYVSTRGGAPALDFEEALLAGLASDGGLYMPESWPELSRKEIGAFAGAPYAEAAFRIIGRFTRDTIEGDELRALIDDSYAEFTHPAIAPLVQTGPNDFMLELFHGPTLAFKDIAMQVLARLTDRALARRDMRATVIGATSGDTGGAAIDAYRGRERCDVFILHPHGRVTDVQRRQMTSCADTNVHNIAVRGSFDDTQAIVKALFGDGKFRERFGLTGVNSINWARIVAQIVYYFTSATALGAPGRNVSYSVPTGNFGDIFAGYAAYRMGLPIERLVIATNENDILARALKTGDYRPMDVVATTSPSMDIQVSSNFERLLFELAGRDAQRVREAMTELGAEGGFSLAASERSAMAALFDAESVSQSEVAETIAALDSAGLLVDPHTAVAVAASRKARGAPATPMVALSTAHPAKFPDAVRRAAGRHPEQPERLVAALKGEERYAVLDNDVGAVADFIAERSRAAREAVA
jgi:threonine synthase